MCLRARVLHWTFAILCLPAGLAEWLSCQASRPLNSPADIHLRLQVGLECAQDVAEQLHMPHFRRTCLQPYTSPELKASLRNATACGEMTGELPDIDAEYEYIRQLQQQREQEEADRMRPLLEDERHHLIEGLKTKWESASWPKPTRGRMSGMRPSFHRLRRILRNSARRTSSSMQTNDAGILHVVLGFLPLKPGKEAAGYGLTASRRCTPPFRY
eukprot:s8168_g3.t1